MGRRPWLWTLKGTCTSSTRRTTACARFLRLASSPRLPATALPVSPETAPAAVNAQLTRPAGVAADSAGNVYISDSANGAVRKVTPDGVINTIAQLNRPQGMAVDAAGNLYVADSADSRIRMISAGGVPSPNAGTGSQNYSRRRRSGDGGSD